MIDIAELKKLSRNWPKFLTKKLEIRDLLYRMAELAMKN